MAQRRVWWVFEIATPADARAVAGFADGVVVGSAAVRVIERAVAAGGDPVPELEAFVADLRAVAGQNRASSGPTRVRRSVTLPGASSGCMRVRISRLSRVIWWASAELAPLAGAARWLVPDAYSEVWQVGAHRRLGGAPWVLAADFPLPG